MTVVHVERQAAEGLSCQRWKFRAEAGYGETGIVVRLDTYWEGERPTRRHMFRPIAGRSHDILGRYNGRPLPEHEVPLPQDVLDEAMGKVRTMVVFTPPAQPQASTGAG